MPPLPQQQQAQEPAGLPQLPAGFEQQVPTAQPTSGAPTATPAQVAPGAKAQPSVDWQAALPGVAQKYGIQPDFIQRVIKAESAGNTGAISPKGAIGLMQLMPNTAKGLGVDPNDPLQNLEGGTRELRRLLDKYKGHYGQALAAYNAGEGAVDGRHFEDLPAETQAYVRGIMEGYQPPQASAIKTGPAAGGPLVPELGGQAPTHGEWLQQQIGGMLPDSVANALGWVQRKVNLPLQHAGQWYGQQMGDVLREAFSEAPIGTPIPKLGEKVGTGVPSAIAGAVGETLGSTVGDPRNWPLLASGTARPLLQRLMSGGFGIQMSASALEAAQDLHQNWDRYTPEERAERITQLGLTGLFAKEGLQHAATGGRPGIPGTAAQPGVTAGPEQRNVPQVGPQQSPNLGQEGGPRPITSPGISGGRELGGDQPRSAVSAPIEQGGGTTGTVTPKPFEGPERRGASQVQLPQNLERREDFMEQARRRAPMQGQESLQSQVQRQRTATAEAAEARRMAWEEQERAKRPPRSAQAPAPTAAPAPTGTESLQSPRPPEVTPYKTGQSLRPQPEPVREPVRAPEVAAQPAARPYQPLPPEQRPRVPAQPPAPAAPIAEPSPNRASIKMMITRADEQQLRERGYSQQDIDRMRPEEAGRILGSPAAKPPTTPQALGEEPRIKPGMKLEEKQEVAQQRDAYLKQRSQTLPTKEALLGATRGPAAEAAATLDRTLTRHLKTVDEVRKDGTSTRPERDKELEAAIQRERAKGPEAVETAAKAMENRATGAEGRIKAVEHLLSKPTQEWDKEMRAMLHEATLKGEVDPDTGKFVPAKGRWIGKEGVQGGRRAKAEAQRTLDAITAEIFNDLRDNTMKEVGQERRLPLDEEGQRNLADRQGQYQELLKQVRTQEGHRPTDEQLVKLKDLMGDIHALRQTRMIAESGPGSEPVGTAVTNKFWNSLMGRPQGSHLGKPSPEMLSARLGELHVEANKAREVAQKLRASAPEAPKTAEAPKLTPQTKKTGPEAATAGNAELAAAEHEEKETWRRGETSKEAVRAPEKPVEAPKPQPRAQAPKASPEPAKPAQTKERSELGALRKQVSGRLSALAADDPSRAQLQDILKQIDAKLGPAERPAPSASAKKGLPAEKYATPTKTEAKPEAKTSGYRTGQTAPESPRTPAEQLTGLVGEARPKASPQAQRRYEQERERVVEQFAADRQAHLDKKKEVQALRSIDPRDYTPQFIERLTTYGKGLKEIEGQHEFLAKVSEARSAFERGDHKAGSAAVQTALAMADQRLIQPKPGKMPVEPSAPTVREPFRGQTKAELIGERLSKINDRIANLPEGADKTNLYQRFGTVSKRLEELSDKITKTSRNIADMKERGQTTRSYTRKSDSAKVTETLEQLEARVRNLGKERMELVNEELPSLMDTIGAFEKKPVAGAPAEQAPTRLEPKVMPTYGPAEIVKDPQTGKYVGTIPGEKTGEKVVTPSPAPREEGPQARQQQLAEMERHLKNLQEKFPSPNKGQAIAMSKLQKGIRAIRASLGKDAPEVAPSAAPTLLGTQMLRRAGELEPRRAAPESTVIPASEMGYVTGAPRMGSVDNAADNLHSWLQGKAESIPPAVMRFIDNNLPRAGEGRGNYLAQPILEALRKGEFGPATGDAAAQKAAVRLQKALDVLFAGRVKALSAPEGERGTGLAKAFSDAMGVAKTGSVPVPRPKTEGQEGFFSLGRKGQGAVGAGRAAQVSRNAIGRLAQTVQKLPASRSMDSRITNALKSSQQAVKTTPGSFAQAYTRTVALSKTLLNAFRALPKWQDFDKALGDFRLIRTRQAYESRNFVKALQDKLGVPSLLRQTLHPIKASAETKAAILRLEAITNYLEAGGDKTELARRAGLASKAHRPGYELASQLNPEEQAIAEAIKAHFESRAKDGLALGILQGAVENYAPHIWMDKGFLNSLNAEMNSGILNRNFRFAMQRIYGSFFEGEQKGLTPKIKRIDALVAIHDEAFNKAMNTRLLARQLFDGTAEDGRPILAINKSSGIKLQGGQKMDPITGKILQRNPAILLKPNSRPFDENLDMSGFKQIPHSAFQKWMWKGSEGGKNILMQSDAWVHPDYHGKLDNLVGTSLIRQNMLGRAALKGTAVLKQSVLGGIGAFHYVQEGLHSVWHLQNPLSPDIWNGQRLNKAMTDPTVLEGIRHGLVVYDGNTAAEFGEGLSVMDKIPGLGKYIRASTDHLFKTFIPSLKVDLYKHVWEKNEARYASDIRSGKISADALKSFSARTVNNAFGELDTLTRNKTFQDVLRLGFLAPDFLEARARFMGQAVRPYGWMPFTAALRSIGLLYAGARIANYAINKDALWDPKYWDAVRIGDKVYRLRSISGDFFHAVTNSSNFLYWRLSPLARPLIGAMAAQRKGLPYRLKDAFTDVVPIPLQGAVKELIGQNVRDPGVGRSLWETFGVHQEKFYTPQQRKAMEQRSETRERALRGEKRQGLGPLLPPLPKLK